MFKLFEHSCRWSWLAPNWKRRGKFTTIAEISFSRWATWSWSTWDCPQRHLPRNPRRDMLRFHLVKHEIFLIFYRANIVFGGCVSCIYWVSFSDFPFCLLLAALWNFSLLFAFGIVVMIFRWCFPVVLGELVLPAICSVLDFQSFICMVFLSTLEFLDFASYWISFDGFIKW